MPLSGLREKKKANTKESLLNAAAQLFSERGFSETTVDQIAEKAEVSKVTFYGYFKAKEDLLTALHNRVLEHALELVNAPEERKLGSVHTLNRLIEAMGKWTEDNVELFKVLLTEKTISFNYCSQKNSQNDCPVVDSIIEIIQAGIVQILVKNELAQHEEQDFRAGLVVIVNRYPVADGRPNGVLHGKRVKLDLLPAEADAQRCGQPDYIARRGRAAEAPPDGDFGG